MAPSGTLRDSGCCSTSFCWLLTPVQKDNGQTKNLNYPFTGLTTSLNEKVKIFMSLFIGLEQTKLPTLYFMFP
jgi:hypothetical protein